MVCWMGPERPTKQPIGLADRHVVDAGLTPAHQVIRTFCVAVSTVNGGKGGLSIEDPASRYRVQSIGIQEPHGTLLLKF
jgi:hypothetical protein